MTPGAVEDAAQAVGLTGLATVAVAPEEGALDGVGAVVLLGLARQGWRFFSASPEIADGQRHPLDRWSERVVRDLAATLGAVALFPFEGPPYHPFLRWSAASGRVWPSALGMSIHETHGPWVSFRGALGFAALDAVPEAGTAPRPCDGCAVKPCLKACPVDAFSGEQYDVERCAAHVASPEGAACRARGCLARRACWIGQDWVPDPARASFHMEAFLRAQESG